MKKTFGISSETGTYYFTKERVLKLTLHLEKGDVYYATLELPPKYRAVIHLFYYEEMSIKEIAEVLELKESNVRARLTRARQKLKEVLKEDV